ncbi:MAG: hypothetical protein OXU20_29155 [Myxococcales bacterium]|nr:hypothetical protein [Myxococcales bacterium]
MTTTETWRIEPAHLVVGAAVAMLVAAGCDRQVSPVENVEVAAAAQAVSAQQPIHHEPGAPPLVVRWDDAGSTHGQTLKAELENTTDVQVSAQIELLAKGPQGDVARMTRGSRVMAPNTSRSVTIPVSALPIQSTGASTALTLVVKYRAQRPKAPELPTGISLPTGDLKAYSEVRYVVFDDDTFQTASIRSSEAQAAHSRGASGGAPVAVRRGAGAEQVAAAPQGSTAAIHRVGGSPGATLAPPGTAD